MMIGRLVKDAADQGYRPDCIVTASDVNLAVHILKCYGRT